MDLRRPIVTISCSTNQKTLNGVLIFKLLKDRPSVLFWGNYPRFSKSIYRSFMSPTPKPPIPHSPPSLLRGMGWGGGKEGGPTLYFYRGVLTHTIKTYFVSFFAYKLFICSLKPTTNHPLDGSSSI